MGGSFGGKLKAPIALSCMATLGVRKFGKPVRIVCDMHTNTNCFGKRLPYYATYKVILLHDDCAIGTVIKNVYGDCFRLERQRRVCFKALRPRFTATPDLLQMRLLLVKE